MTSKRIAADTNVLLADADGGTCAQTNRILAAELAFTRTPRWRGGRYRRVTTQKETMTP
jgi:hypothetical protein